MLNHEQKFISIMSKSPYLSCKRAKDKIDFSKLTYMPEFKQGKLINSGLSADVFEIQKYPDLIVRVERGTKYNPLDIRRAKENVRHIWASNSDETVTIMRRVKGEPLYGAKWSIWDNPDKTEYMKTLDEVLNLPDSTFNKYIDDIENIRANGCRVDTVNPNNILLDKKTKQVNIIDIDKGKNIKNYTNVEDFYPFVDERRIIQVMRSMNTSEREVLSKKIKQFFARIEKIGNERNIDLSVEKPDHNKLQDITTYIVHDDKPMLDLYLN